MKKVYILLCALLCSLSGFSQNYQCLQSGVKHFFTNNVGYLRGIRIDSVKTYVDSTIYYPFHTPRGRYGFTIHTPLDTTGGSWLGKKVMQLADGTFLFDNIWNDTVVIKTQAHTGDIWHLYDDTTTLYYQAEITAEDTMTVLGMLDSVKKLLITAKNPSGIVTTDPVNGLQLILSKNNGFIQAIDLYMFPYHAPDSAFTSGIDFFLDCASGKNSMFTLVPFSWPTRTQLYNWNVGDVFELKYCDSRYSAFDCEFPSEFLFDSVTSKIVFPDSTQYTTVGWQAIQHRYSDDPLDVYYPYDRGVTNKSFTIPNTPLFDTSIFPEEYGQGSIFYYFPADTSLCMQSEKYETFPNDFGQAHEGAGPDKTYKNEIDLVAQYSEGSPRLTDEIFGMSLMYYTHNGISCGKYIGSSALSVAEVNDRSATIKLFPNPVTEELTITSDKQINNVVITNLLGQAVYTGNHQGRQAHIPVSGLRTGMYMVRVNGTETRKFIKE